MDSVTARALIVATATRMLAGETDLLAGCRAILKARRELEDPMGALFLVFEGVDSETDDLPEGVARDSWDPVALQRKDTEKEEYLRRARGPLLEACRRIVETLAD